MLGALDSGGGSNGCGAFLPFTKEKAGMADSAAALPELALAPSEKDTAVAGESDRKPYHDDVARRDIVQNGAPPTSTAQEGQAVPPPPQTNRKARRCWSPELHRRFVNALQILGGAQGIHTDSLIHMSTCTNDLSIDASNLTAELFTCVLKTNSKSPLLFVKVATPKQIRELMKVDGLTNDEVKSHLQVIIISSSSLLHFLCVRSSNYACNCFNYE
jgi:hypothetical protein